MMKSSFLSGLFAVVVVGCAVEDAPRGDAPAADSLGLEAQGAGAFVDGWSIYAEQPTQVSTYNVTGSFSIGGNFGTRSGGACLVKDTSGWSTCTPEPRADGRGTGPECAAPPTGGFVYCMAAEQDGSSPHCWTRPGPPSSFCNQGSRLATYTTYQLPTAASFVGERWVVLGCLNPASDPGACGRFPASSGAVYALGFSLTTSDGSGPPSEL